MTPTADTAGVPHRGGLPIPEGPGRRGGGWMVGTVVAGSIVTAGTLVAFVLSAREFDWDENALAAVRSIAVAIVPVAVAIVLGVLLLSGRPWARWLTTAVLGAGALWVLFLAEFDRTALYPSLAFAVVWGLGAVALAVVPGVAPFLADRRAASYRYRLGALDTPADAARWLATLDAWRRGRLVSRRERRRIVRILSGWIERHADDMSGDTLKALRRDLPRDLETWRGRGSAPGTLP